MLERLDAMERRLEVLDRQLSDPDVVSDPTQLRELSREHADVSDVVTAYRAYKGLIAERAGAREMVEEEEDPELRRMAREEITALDEAIDTAKAALRLKLLPKDPYEGRPLMLEIRAGTGGDEAALFAADLYRMYQRYGERHGLRFAEMEISPGSVGGFKEIVASVTGEQAWHRLRFEAGVHRVQRVPATESQGRIHTSAATVAVLPEPDEVEIDLDMKDLRIDVMRASGPGGQSVNTTDSAVRIVHLPTGIMATCQDEKSQTKNKAKAMRVLKARLLAKAEEEAAAEGNAARRAMVGSGDRSERIRTYNYPQNRVTDHRIDLTLYKLDRIVDGDADELVDSLTAAWRTAQLETMGEAQGAS